MKITAFIILCLSSISVLADSAPFDLSITGDGISVNKSLELSDVGEGKTSIEFDFSNDQGVRYSFDLQYVALPSNRSYPTNLDITVKDEKGEKLGYLFWANNGVKSLQKIGVFGFIIDVDGDPMDLRFAFDSTKQGDLQVASLENERLVQDTLVSNFGFQMIRPVLVPLIEEGVRSQTYQLDNHPYAVNYTLKDLERGNVEFQYNLYRIQNDNEHLLQRVYYHADSLSTLREGMFAGKYFDNDIGTAKLVFYPALGQTEP